LESHQRKSFRLIDVRTAVLGTLLALPVLTCVVAGALAIWRIGWTGLLWWIIPGFWLLTWIVSKLWRIPRSPDALPPAAGHWTPRDQQAAGIVQRYQRQLDELQPAQLTDMHFYLNQSQRLAAELARHYHPNTAHPMDGLTAPEIAAAIRLVADDLERLVLDSIPGSRLLTVGHWKALGKAPKWIRRLSNTVWAGAILMNPLNIARYGSSRVTSDRVAGSLQVELLATLYLRFIRQTGFYLIEMNSGRLRGGADAWRAAFERSTGSAAAREPDAQGVASAPGGASTKMESAAPTLRIAIVGQTSAGKSSLVNALMGSTAARVNILPETMETARYELRLDSATAPLLLLDTPGYLQAGANAAQMRAIQAALQESDAALLVMDAHTPARDGDKRVLRELHAYFDAQPQLRLPPVIGVLTHVDLLPPALQWNPPCDSWQDDASPKAASIRGAVEYTADVLGAWIVDCVPVCADGERQRTWGIAGNLLPALVAHLDEARSVALVSAFEKSLDQHRLSTLLRQAVSSGKQLLRTWLDERL
jgi:predicted GTPase